MWLADHAWATVLKRHDRLTFVVFGYVARQGQAACVSHQWVRRRKGARSHPSMPMCQLPGTGSPPIPSQEPRAWCKHLTALCQGGHTATALVFMLTWLFLKTPFPKMLLKSCFLHRGNGISIFLIPAVEEWLLKTDLIDKAFFSFKYWVVLAWNHFVFICDQMMGAFIRHQTFPVLMLTIPEKRELQNLLPLKSESERNFKGIMIK